MTKKSQELPPSAIRAYNTVVKLLRDRINSGHYQIGEWLPTERILAEDLVVDRRIIRTAVNQLVEDGLVDRRPNCRPIVARVQNVPSGNADSSVPSSARDPLSASNLVALIMWHGGGEGLEQQSNTSQQRIFWGINHTLIDMGYHTVFLDLGQVGEEEDNARREAAHLRYVMDRGFGGAIFYPYAYRSNHALVQEVLQTTPLVMIDRRIAPIETDFVRTANYQAMFDTVMHLVEQGHQRIAYVSKFEIIQSVQDRIQGYLDAVRTANINEIVLTMPAQNRDFEWTVVDSVFRLPKGERPTAAAVFNDYAACDLLDHLKGLGLSVPGDVAITGFDNIIPMHPNGLGMTTVAQSYEEIGQNAAKLLLRRLKDPKAPFTSIELPGTLIVRESSSAKVAG